MEQYEYGRLDEFDLHLTMGRPVESAYVLTTESGFQLLQPASQFGALNEVGRRGWVVYQLSSSMPNGSMPVSLLDEVATRFGERPSRGQWVAWWLLRRTIT